MPKISICIPAYNRPDELVQVLQSVAAQGAGPWDVVICEDRSPRGDEIEAAVAAFARQHPTLDIKFHRNDKNLGYDGNLRRLLDVACGEYCMFIGDDDELAPDALRKAVQVLNRPDIGFMLRAWKSVDKETGADIEIHRYFPDDREFPPGPQSVAALYRRSVFISGLTVHRETARSFHTDRFDGMLLYQLYLVGRIVAVKSGYYLSETIAVRRVGGEHFFGSSDKEKDRFVPKQLLPTHSVLFLKGLFDIARVLDTEYLPGVYDLIRSDLGRYSYPMLEIQAHQLSKREFKAYAGELASIGLKGAILFRVYYFTLLFLGPGLSNILIRGAKRLLGGTPNLGGSAGVRA